MNANVSKLLNEQINKEFYSAYLYLDFANYYAAVGLDGFENWYRVQAQEERDHAMLFYQYLQNNGEGVTFEAIAKPEWERGDHMTPLKKALAHEKLVTAIETKLSDTYISLFLLAVCCGMLMYIAVATFKKQPNILGTIAVFLCVSVFILAGFEHCIANMFYFGLVSTPTKYAVPLLIMILGNSTGGILLCKLTQHVQIQKNSENA